MSHPNRPTYLSAILAILVCATIGGVPTFAGDAESETVDGGEAVVDVVIEVVGEVVVETENFRVVAGSRSLALLIAERAERQRAAVALRWLGRELPTWSTPCTIDVHEGTTSNRGATSYELVRGDVRTLGITLHGEVADLVGTVLPHEIVHAVVVSGLGRRPPRWADEGIAMTAEPSIVRERQRRLAVEVSASADGLRVRELLHTRDYPASRGELLAFYARSYSVTAFLVDRSDTATFLSFVQRGRSRGWDRAARECFGYASVESLETDCAEWLRNPTTADAAREFAVATE